MNQSSDTILLSGVFHGTVLDDMKQITLGSTFLYDQEHKLLHVLLDAFAEMNFVAHQFQNSHDYLVSHGTPDIDTYIAELNEMPSTSSKTNLIIELNAYDLSALFKSFLLLVKSVLDKLVPFYSYRFYDNMKQFSDKGTRLIKAIKSNKNVGKKAELVTLIEHAKRDWIDPLIAMRDEYIHYSDLKEYRNFWISAEVIGTRTFSGLADFHKPSIYVGGTHHEALEYISTSKNKLINFLQKFLLLCEFTPERRPKHYFECECGHVFVKRQKKGTKKKDKSKSSRR